MKKILSLITAVLLLISLLTGCAPRQPVNEYDYKDAYERLSKTVMEQGYMLEDLGAVPATDQTPTGICICLGDSVTGIPSEQDCYTSYIARETGMKVVNGGFGDVTLARNPVEEHDPFSLYRIADAMVTGDWSAQEEAIKTVEWANADAHLTSLKAVDWTAIDMITIAYGSNDLVLGTSLDDSSDTMSTDTVCGALRYSLNRIQTAYPHIRLILMTPTYRVINNEEGEAAYSYGDGIDAMIHTADEYNIPIAELYDTLGVNSINSTYYLGDDGVVPNSKGQKLIGRRAVYVIEQ